MMMIVDLSSTDINVTEIIDHLDSIGKELGVRIQLQRDEIFDSMHRI
jgi:ACT domain-containing protein